VRPVSKHAKYVPKHRHATSRSIAQAAPAKVLRTTVLLSSVAVAATGVAVSGGVLSTPASVSNAAENVAAPVTSTTSSTATSRAAERLPARTPIVSRSDRRDATDPTKEAALSQADGPGLTRTEDASDDDPRAIARSLMGEFGFSSDQFGCLDSLWTRESGWQLDADNPSSSAYGIPQALPGEKMASAGADWATNPATQIRWGLGYIADSYGSPCGAWAHSESYNWY
jgi:hypothetical protein